MEEVDLTDFFLGAQNARVLRDQILRDQILRGKDLKKDMQGYCIFSCDFFAFFLSGGCKFHLFPGWFGCRCTS